jgi:hypothetical protein
MLDAAAWCALVAAAFVLAHPYGGIVHDGILYFAQALARIRPEIYAPDIFFKWGSQDRYSVFSPIYSALLLEFGVNWTNVLLVASSQALFLGASYLFIRKLVEPPMRGYGLLLVACSNGVYGGYFIFRMAEPFVTPRPFVEAATLFAMALVCSGRKVPAFAVLFGAALLHPLVALIGFLFAWLYLVAEDRRWAWAAVGAVPVLGAGLAGVQPFAQLFQQFDGEWLQSLVEQNQHIFLTEWTFYDWALLACDLILATLALCLTAGVTRRAVGAVLALAGIGLLASFVGGDLIHSVLLTNLQLWRGLWLLHWMSAALLPFIAWRMWREGPVGQLIAGLAVFVFAFRGLPSGLGAAAVLALLFYCRGRLELRSRLAVAALVGLVAAGLVNWLLALSLTRNVALISAMDPIQEYVVRALGKPFPLLVIGAGIGFWLLRNPAPWQKGAAALVLAATSVLLWDQRVPMRRYIESVELGTHPFSKVVGPQEEVFWYGDVVAPWVLMQRRSYMSAAQKAGQMFNRETAIELLMRRTALNVVEFQAEICLLVNAINRRQDACHPDLEAVATACREAPGLDYVVLENPIAKEWVATWTPPVEIPYRRPHFYLYDCKKLVDS